MSQSSIQQLKKTVEQLRHEANIDRMKVSQAGAELQAYCQEHAREDMLLTGVPTAANPFKEKKTCLIL